MKKPVFLLMLTVFVGATSIVFGQQTKPWNIPDKAAKTPNAVKTSAASIAAGKTLWTQHCASCHGKTGLGDGNKAAQLKTTPPDFTKSEFQSQSDGTLFYQVQEGRDDMPSFKKKIPDADDAWNLVNFMRSLKK
ncbi:MAG: cytochrome c [Chitinophagaceae bacterium]|jgi:mono/diheme cytochrome c family protein|nr:cytochrome c [Chitinophagaceae bacterium]